MILVFKLDFVILFILNKKALKKLKIFLQLSLLKYHCIKKKVINFILSILKTCYSITPTYQSTLLTQMLFENNYL